MAGFIEIDGMPLCRRCEVLTSLKYYSVDGEWKKISCSLADKSIEEIQEMLTIVQGVFPTAQIHACDGCPAAAEEDAMADRMLAECRAGSPDYTQID